MDNPILTRQEMSRITKAAKNGNEDASRLQAILDAAQSDNGEALYFLGTVLQQGALGEFQIGPSPEKAQQCFLRAATQGHAKAKTMLASVDQESKPISGKPNGIILDGELLAFSLGLPNALTPNMVAAFTNQPLEARNSLRGAMAKEFAGATDPKLLVLFEHFVEPFLNKDAERLKEQMRRTFVFPMAAFTKEELNACFAQGVKELVKDQNVSREPIKSYLAKGNAVANGVWREFESILALTRVDALSEVMLFFAMTILSGATRNGCSYLLNASEWGENWALTQEINETILTVEKAVGISQKWHRSLLNQIMGGVLSWR
jgi:hypothetical protein